MQPGYSRPRISKTAPKSLEIRLEEKKWRLCSPRQPDQPKRAIEPLEEILNSLFLVQMARLFLNDNLGDHHNRAVAHRLQLKLCFQRRAESFLPLPGNREGVVSLLDHLDDPEHLRDGLVLGVDHCSTFLLQDAENAINVEFGVL